MMARAAVMLGSVLLLVGCLSISQACVQFSANPSAGQGVLIDNLTTRCQATGPTGTTVVNAQTTTTWVWSCSGSGISASMTLYQPSTILSFDYAYCQLKYSFGAQYTQSYYTNEVYNCPYRPGDSVASCVIDAKTTSTTLTTSSAPPPSTGIVVAAFTWQPPEYIWTSYWNVYTLPSAAVQAKSYVYPCAVMSASGVMLNQFTVATNDAQGYSHSFFDMTAVPSLTLTGATVGGQTGCVYNPSKTQLVCGDGSFTAPCTSGPTPVPTAGFPAGSSCAAVATASFCITSSCVKDTRAYCVW